MRYQIDRVVSYAAELHCTAKLIHLICSDETASQRLSLIHVAKNRTFELYLKVKRSLEPIQHPHLTLNTDDGLNGVLLQKSLQYLKSD